MPATRVYADAVGVMPVDREARDVYLAALDDGWADPARLHAEGRRAKEMLDDVREEMAALLVAHPAHTHFAPTPAVSAERLIMGLAAARSGRFRVVASAVESAMITDAVHHVGPDALDSIPVDEHGRVRLDLLIRAVTVVDVAFIALQHANREVGTIQPVEDAHAAATVSKVPLVVDATASIGPLDPPREWDALLADPTSWGGPGGFGVLALRPNVRWLPCWPSGTPWATGSVGIPAALAAAAALRKSHASRQEATRKVAAATARLRRAIQSIPNSVLLGHPLDQMPHVTAVSFVYADAVAVARALDACGFAVGCGCTCGRHPSGPCPALTAMGAMTHGAIRLGLHPGIVDEDIDALGAALIGAVHSVRLSLGAPQ
ncbi:MAG: aminotransferase class V-fold PLP-dependent enzyme [Demequinaceae bacterium]|nr:aminotransferase class V-fold PLP-dependent enzyme [Demequinaceae bacterium]